MFSNKLSLLIIFLLATFGTARMLNLCHWHDCQVKIDSHFSVANTDSSTDVLTTLSANDTFSVFGGTTYYSTSTNTSSFNELDVNIFVYNVSKELCSDDAYACWLRRRVITPIELKNFAFGGYVSYDGSTYSFKCIARFELPDHDSDIQVIVTLETCIALTDDNHCTRNEGEKKGGKNNWNGIKDELYRIK